MNKQSRAHVFYLGSFPPPYGGATKKNEALFRELSRQGEICRVNFSLVKKRSVKEIARFLSVLLFCKATFVVGVSGAQTRRMLTMFLSRVNPWAMRRSVLVVMGGVASKQIARDSTYCAAVAKYKKVFVETKGMVAELRDAGLNNVEIYPNARERIDVPERIAPVRDRQMRCVYFAQVSYEKGFDVAIDAVELLAKEGMDISCDFFGKVPDPQVGLVTESINAAPHCEYHGVFKGEVREIAALLSGYDLLLFPTRWDTEGVPGTLVEALIAGTSCIAPRKSYNADVVSDGISGLIVDESEPMAFAAAIRKASSPTLLMHLSHGAKKSSEEYFMDNCVPRVVKAVFD